MIVLIVEFLLISTYTLTAGAAGYRTHQAKELSTWPQQNVPTLIPTVTASLAIAATSENRTLPAVGSNALLVIGASLLVLIIILGVVFSSRRTSKH